MDILQLLIITFSCHFNKYALVHTTVLSKQALGQSQPSGAENFPLYENGMKYLLIKRLRSWVRMGKWMF